jgi:hypothetical protein
MDLKNLKYTLINKINIELNNIKRVFVMCAASEGLEDMLTLHRGHLNSAAVSLLR